MAAAEPKPLLEIAAAGLGCLCADSLFNGLEVLKVRAQLAKDSSALLPLAREISREHGVGAILLPGLGATWLRALTYTGFRIGAYPEAKRQLQKATGAPQNAAHVRIGSGLLTGSIGAALFTPVDLVRVRIQGGMLPLSHVPPAARTVRAFTLVVAEGGLSALYRGWSACVLRAALLSSAQLASYDTLKSVARSIGQRAHMPTATANEGPALHACLSFASGFIAQTVVQPADTVRTQLLSGHAQDSLLGCALSIVRSGGAAALYRGYIPAVLRQGPVMAIQMPLVEEFRRLLGLGYM